MVNKNIRNRAYIYTGDKSGQVTVAISQKFLDTVLFYIQCVLFSLRREGRAGWVWRRAMEGTSWTCVLGIPTSQQICAALLRVARGHFLQQKGKFMHSNYHRYYPIEFPLVFCEVAKNACTIYSSPREKFVHLRLYYRSMLSYFMKPVNATFVC